MTLTVIIAFLSAIPSILLLPFEGAEGFAVIWEMISDVFHDIARNLYYIF